ncbi:hypothetical protein HYPBUDRAFT_153858 [Hyphopichia burtonii NRRL Y-1933]|uniref:WW domain-containing protein n=1 Tax=Hyphopichia burtonii NRRL Y-1933 TaxID=984485 RepID=A0A1E4REE1_9ASCO|nr:hypothetical protein HYPBUDRAFT_153858 [Hyphopichia burtonii NRRL Y-1933]ODV65638.1 hypothetical protein HYPBUDRAFT_153858 [Hyphopichia burtonii NRRL Y-1933]
MTVEDQTIWKFKYDDTFKQYYYINTKDNSISFDLPCEVKNTSSNNTSFINHIMSKKSHHPRSNTSKNLLHRISSAFSLKLSKSNEEKKPAMLLPQTRSHQDDISLMSGLGDEFLLQPSFNLNKYNTNSPADSQSILSYDDEIYDDESIHSYYSDLNNYEVYQDEEDMKEEFNKYKERMELRLQFIKELES